MDASGSQNPTDLASGRKAVFKVLVEQLKGAIDGLTDRQAATPKLRFADVAAR